MMALKCNKMLDITKAVWRKKVQATVTLAMVHTVTPSSQEYTILAEKLVT